ncbi:mavicyanin [Euphorbia lathyris]|uniref:mavicyanin n=1 Tax=Euphorbia lathyris TaxID=212925 RepID=UPI00331339D7
MAMVNRGVAVVITAMALFEAVLLEATVYKVGDTAGWTTIGNIDYKQWSATKTFHLGDLIVFEYNSQFHNVMRVTHNMYKSCNASAPMATYTTGNDSVTIKTRGHHYFICGVPGHCQAGQKLDINVPRLHVQQLAPSPSSSSISTPAAPNSPSVPAAKVSGPSPNSAASFKPMLAVFLGLFLFNFACVQFYMY